MKFRYAFSLSAVALAVVALAACGSRGATPSIDTPAPVSTAAPLPTTAAPQSPTATAVEPAGPDASPLGPAGPSSSPLATESPLPTPASLSAGPYRPLSSPSCEDFRVMVQETLGGQAKSQVGPFQDPLAGVGGRGCWVQLLGTGADFGTLVDVSQKLRTAFEQEGWQDEMDYTADSPTATMWAMRKDAALALFGVAWTPAKGVKCPQDQPISSCEVTPEQQEFMITVSAATK